MVKIKLTQSEIYFLSNYSSYKSFARRDNFSCQYALKRYTDKYGPLSESYDQLEASLIEKKVLARSKNGTVRSKLDYNETKELIAYQTDTKDELLSQIEKTKQDIRDAQSHYETLVDGGWPSQSHFAKKGIGESLVYAKEQLSQLETRLRNVS